MVHREKEECERSIEGSNAVMTDTMICAGSLVTSFGFFVLVYSLILFLILFVNSNDLQ